MVCSTNIASHLQNGTKINIYLNENEQKEEHFIKTLTEKLNISLQGTNTDKCRQNQRAAFSIYVYIQIVNNLCSSVSDFGLKGTLIYTIL